MWGGGLKTETGKLHEILTSVCVGGGLKTETGKFLLHFQNSKSSNRYRSVYGTDIIVLHLICPHTVAEARYTLFRHVLLLLSNIRSIWANPNRRQAAPSTRYTSISVVENNTI